MDKCFICGIDCYSTFTRRNRFLHGLYDNVTGETFDLCTKCVTRLISRESKIIFDNIKKQGIRSTLRGLYEINKITPGDLDFINTTTVDILSRKYLKNCTGYILYNFDHYLLFDEGNRQMLLNNTTICSFDEVADYKVLDHSVDVNVQSPESTEYTTKSKNALGRSFVGSVLAGPVGAFVGGVTAQHKLQVNKSGFSTYSTTTHDYSIVVLLKRLGNNSIILTVGENEGDVTVLCNALDAIISLSRQ